MAMRRVTVDNISIQFEERGEVSNPPVVFIHGSASDYRTWETQLDAFVEKYHVIAYSRRSHYPNPYVEYDSNYSIRTESTDLAMFIEALNLHAPAHLIGWSYGAFIAAVTAREHSRLVESLVLAEPPIMSFLTASPRTEKLYLDYAAKVSTINSYLNLGMDKEAVECFIDAVSGTGAFGHTPPEQQQRMLQNAKTLYELTSPERDPFSTGDTQEIDVPTLLVSGEKSPPFLKRIINELSNHLPTKEEIVIQNASHVMHRQNIAEYNRVVLDFIDKH